MIPVSLDRQRIISATPTASLQPSHERALAALDAGAVASVAADTSQPWWRRRACIRSLEGRLPGEAAPALWSRVKDSKDVAEVRVAALSALCAWWSTLPPETSADARERALTWLRGQAPAQLAYGMVEAVTLARCKLGDPTVISRLAELTYDPWWHRTLVADEAVAALLTARGLTPFLAAYGVTTLAELVTAGADGRARYLGLALLRRESPADVQTRVCALEDEDIVVAQRAARDLVDAELSEASLLQIFDERGDDLRAAATAPAPLTGRPAAACWALMTIARRHARVASGDDEPTPCPTPEILEHLSSLGLCEVPSPDIPRDVRQAILSAHLPGERTTDPRHLVEGLTLERHDLDARAELPHQARQALLAAGLAAGEPTPIGVVHSQGGGSYDLLDVGEGQLAICTFGPFARATTPVSEEATMVLERAGFRIIDDELAGRVVEGLPVYYFGNREPLTVQDLLFYWQD